MFVAVGAFVTVFNRELSEERAAVRAEQEKVEGLLMNILPRAIVGRLKENQQPIADNFPSVTVLFADIVGFTTLSSLLAPEEVVTRLNEIFSAFDDLASRHGLEKNEAWWRSRARGS